jgi:probable HAF family extracellular repeat protein
VRYVSTQQWLGAVGSLAFMASAAGAAPSYTFVELSTFPGSPFSQIIGMNNLAQTAGGMDRADGTRRAVIWNPDGTFVDIGTLGGRTSFATSVTDAGMAFGSADTPANVRHAYRYVGGVMEDLGTFGGVTSNVIDGNASGAAGGFAQTASGEIHPAYWAPGSRTAIDLGTFGGPEGQVLSISSLGVAVGRAEDPQGYKHAFRWTPGGTLERLGEPAGWDGSRAHGINASGRIAGWLETGVPAGPPFGAIVWHAPGVFHDAAASAGLGRGAGLRDQ